MYDKMGIDRKGKDIDHIKPLRKGGTSTKSNLRLRSKKANEEIINKMQIVDNKALLIKTRSPEVQHHPQAQGQSTTLTASVK